MTGPLQIAKAKPLPTIAIALGLAALTIGLIEKGRLCKAISTDDKVLRDCHCLGYKVLESRADDGDWLREDLKETYRCVGFVSASHSFENAPDTSAGSQ